MPALVASALARGDGDGEDTHVDDDVRDHEVAAAVAGHVHAAQNQDGDEVEGGCCDDGVHGVLRGVYLVLFCLITSVLSESVFSLC